MQTPEGAADFFISRAGANAAFAAEIGRILEDDGKTVVLQQWDCANRNFMERMHRALESGARVIALLSPRERPLRGRMAERDRPRPPEPERPADRAAGRRIDADRPAHRAGLLGLGAGPRRPEPRARHRARRRAARPPQG